MKNTYLKISGLALIAFCAVPASNALSFNFSYSGSIDSRALAGFQAAGAIYSSLFTDDITINIKIGFDSLGSGILGQSSSSYQTNTYSSVRSALASDATSAADTKAVSSLENSSTLHVRTNLWANSPNGAGSSTAYTASITNMAVTYANAKALGLRSATDSAIDSQITFSSNFTWDFDRSDGITSSSFDFVGIAVHEIGHSLGFVSGVDILDYYSSSYNDSITWVRPLDLYRYSSSSSLPDLTAGTSVKYFSLDNGATGSSNLFSTGRYRGDGYQASHWKDNLGLGIMDPTANYGEYMNVTNLDIAAFDVIGYNVKAVPEPASMIALALGGIAVLARRKRK